MRRQQGRVESWRAKAKFLATFGSVELQLLLIRIIRWNYDRTSGGDFCRPNANTVVKMKNI